MERLRALVGHTLNAPFLFLLDQLKTRPEPVAPGLFIEGRRHRYLGKPAGAIGENERPANLYLRRLRLKAIFSLLKECDAQVAGVSRCRPLLPALNPRLARQSLA